ncbi:hypothetical protein HPP92_021441 [Vanilla planifolia]|uniref:Glycoside hydrolase family 5 domain-containing protein n=1 Tax=Vanilla planifolia TaxID=51239 RepID=A0A835Q146_VANPL|nr:hypothetical protein HPP92_021441 [Vanilla planifolia]
MNPLFLICLLFAPLLFPHWNPTTATFASEEVGFLSTASRWVVDQSGRRVKLACANWAAHLDPIVAEGLGSRPVGDIAAAVRSMGFNCVRLTWPLYLVTNASLTSVTVGESLRRLGLVESAAGVAVNNPQFVDLTLIQAFKDIISIISKTKPELLYKDALLIMQKVVSTLDRHDIMVILDNQISTPGWCCSKYDGNGFFGDTFFDPNEWLRGLQIMAETFNSSRNVVGMSLRNELRGPKQNLVDWYRYMQMGAEAVHLVNPNVLVILSGLDYDKVLTFLSVKQVELTFEGKLVFELHWYGFSDGGDWKNGNINAVCANISRLMMVKGGFLLKQGFPLFLSEFGVDIRGYNQGDNHFLSCFLSVAAELDFDWAIWALQGSYYIREGKPNFDETYGVLSSDWRKPRNLNFLQRIEALQYPFQGPGLSNRSSHHIIFHPLTGLCVLQSRSNGEPVLGSCGEYQAWSYTSELNLVLKDAGLCLQAGADGEEVKFGTQCKNLGSKWVQITDSRMLLSTYAEDNGHMVCLDLGPENSIITSTCKCLVEEGPCSSESQWFKIVDSKEKVAHIIYS